MGVMIKCAYCINAQKCSYYMSDGNDTNKFCEVLKSKDALGFLSTLESMMTGDLSELKEQYINISADVNCIINKYQISVDALTRKIPMTWEAVRGLYKASLTNVDILDYITLDTPVECYKYLPKVVLNNMDVRKFIEKYKTFLGSNKADYFITYLFDFAYTSEDVAYGIASDWIWSEIQRSLLQSKYNTFEGEVKRELLPLLARLSKRFGDLTKFMEGHETLIYDDLKGIILQAVELSEYGYDLTSVSVIDWNNHITGLTIGSEFKLNRGTILVDTLDDMEKLNYFLLARLAVNKDYIILTPERFIV